MKKLIIMLLLISSTAYAHEDMYITMSGVSNTSEFSSVNVTLGYRHHNVFAEGYTLGGGAVGLFKEINDWRFNAGLAYTNRYTPMLGVDYKGFSVKAMQYNETYYSTEKRYVSYSDDHNRNITGYFDSLVAESRTSNMVMFGYTLEF